MIAVTRIVQTDKPIDAVASYLSDFTTTEAWDPGTVTTKKLDAGEVTVGTRYENVSTFLGRKTTLQYRVVELTPGQRIQLTGTNKTVESTDLMSFESSGSGTKVTYRAELRFAGVARFLEPVLRLAFNRVADKAADGLQRELDKL